MKNFFAVKMSLLIVAVIAFAGCQPTTTTTTTTNTTTNTVNQTTTNTNSNANVAMTTNVNGNSVTAPGTAVEASEPEQYQAKVTVTFEAGGSDKKTALPAIAAQVARSGDNRRMEFTLPSGEKIVYLDLGGRQLIVSPQRKEYGELNKDSLGIDVRRLLTPSQIISQVKGLKGVEHVGDEKFNGRDAVKYQYSSVTDTKTKAGNVDTSSVIYIDKETGLPLHSETNSASQNSSVNGLNSARFVTEMSNIQTTADQSLFVEPTDYKKVEPEQIRQQLQTIFNVVGAFIGQMMQQSQQTVANPSPTATTR